MDVAWVAILGPVCGAIGFTVDRVVGPGRKIRRRLHGFLEDWEGEPERRTPDGARLLEPRRPGMPERMATVEGDVAEIKALLNGGGIGQQMQALDSKISEHIERADLTRDEILHDVRDARRLVGEAVMVLSTNQQSLQDRIDRLDQKVEGRLFVLEEAERAHRAVLHELGLPVTEFPELGAEQ